MRVKRAVHARKRKNSLFKAAKGYRGGRSRLLRTVKMRLTVQESIAIVTEKSKNVIFVVFGLCE